MALSFLTFLFSWNAYAAHYSCPVSAQQGVQSVSFELAPESNSTAAVFTFNSGIESQPEACQVQRLGEVASLLCTGPTRLKDELLTSILVNGEKVSVRFFDHEKPGLPDFGPGGPIAPCEIH